MAAAGDETLVGRDEVVVQEVVPGVIGPGPALAPSFGVPEFKRKPFD
jgi:hypothetical protein